MVSVVQRATSSGSQSSAPSNRAAKVIADAYAAYDDKPDKQNGGKKHQWSEKNKVYSTGKKYALTVADVKAIKQAWESDGGKVFGPNRKNYEKAKDCLILNLNYANMSYHAIIDGTDSDNPLLDQFVAEYGQGIKAKIQWS